MTKKQATQNTSIVPANYVTSPGPDSLVLAVYNAGSAVIHDERHLELEAGHNTVYLEGMPGRYQPASLMVKSYEGPGDLKLGGSSYRAPNLDEARVLAQSVGKPVVVKELLGGKLTHTPGTLLAVLGAKVAVKRDRGAVSLVPASQVDLEEGLPHGLSATPSILTTLQASNTGSFKLYLMHEASGFSWKARHSLFLDEATGKLTLWDTTVAITNGSGARYFGAKVRLIAASNQSPRGGAGLEMAMASAAPMARSVQADFVGSETVGDVQTYLLPGHITINDGELQQVTLLRTEGVPFKKEYFLAAGQYYQANEEDLPKQPVNVRLRLVNSKENKLGTALPAGEISILQNDSTGVPQKVGNATLAHTADGEDFKIEYGPSSDVKVTRRLIEVQQDEEQHRVYPLEGGPQTTSMRPVVPQEKTPLFREEEREIVVHNYKDKPVKVIVEDWIPEKATWLKKPEGHEFFQNGPHMGGVKVAVEPKGKTVVRFRLRYQTN